MWTTSELPGVRVITSCFKWKAEKSIKIVTKPPLFVKTLPPINAFNYECLTQSMSQSLYEHSARSKTSKQHQCFLSVQCQLLNYTYFFFFRGQQRTNSLLARISALRNGSREGAGYKSLSNISIFFLFYTAASRTRSNLWEKISN